MAGVERECEAHDGEYSDISGDDDGDSDIHCNNDYNDHNRHIHDVNGRDEGWGR